MVERALPREPAAGIRSLHPKRREQLNLLQERSIAKRFHTLGFWFGLRAGGPRLFRFNGEDNGGQRQNRKAAQAGGCGFGFEAGTVATEFYAFELFEPDR